jgi:predicted amidohydrolase YtcJ
MTSTMRFLRPTTRLAAALVPFASASLAAQGAPAASAPGTVAFVDVSVIPMTGTGPQVLANRTVIVRDGRIAQIGAAGTLSPPAGATVIQGRGKYLIPGLAEMHAHLPGANAPAPARARHPLPLRRQRHHDDPRHARRTEPARPAPADGVWASCSVRRSSSERRR